MNIKTEAKQKTNIRLYKFENKLTKLSIMRNVHDFLEIFSCCVLPGTSCVICTPLSYMEPQ